MRLRLKAQEVRMLMNSGAITYSEAKRILEPHITKANEMNKIISKKHGMPYRAITFSGVIR